MAFIPSPWALAHQDFTALMGKAYFNYGGQGPMAQSTLTAIIQGFESLQRLGPFSSQAYGWVSGETEALRGALADLLGVAPGTIALTDNVSIGCNIALWGLDWHAGDHIVMSDCEHQGVIAAVQEIARRFGVEVSIAPLMATLNQGDPVATIAQLLRPRTRLVVFSHILWNTGQVLPMGAIAQACRTFASDRPIRLLVDAAQSVGVLPLAGELESVDFYAFTGHKWLCGPQGVGGLYIHPGAMADLSPTWIGWRSVVIDQNNQPKRFKPDASRYEVATSAYPMYAGLSAAIAHHPGTAGDRYQRILELSALLWQRLHDLPGVEPLRHSPPEAGLVSFQLPGHSPEAVMQALESQQIYLRTLLSPPCLRACVHYFTQSAEIEQLVGAIAAYLHRV